MGELRYLGTLWSYATARLWAARREDGSPSVEWIIIAAVVAAGALALTAIVMAKLTAKAESIPTE